MRILLFGAAHRMVGAGVLREMPARLRRDGDQGGWTHPDRTRASQAARDRRPGPVRSRTDGMAEYDGIRRLLLLPRG